MFMVMFSPCAHQGCSRYALAQADFCLRHLPAPQQVLDQITDGLLNHERFIGWNLSEISFADIPIKGKSFSNCMFSHCTFPASVFDECRIETSFFDFSTFTDCTWQNCTIHNSTFAGSEIHSSQFKDSILFQVSLNGITSRHLQFHSCDLFRSSLIAADLIDTEFDDCNMKRVNFIRSHRENVRFQWSNEVEAIFTEKESRQSRYTPLERL